MRAAKTAAGRLLAAALVALAIGCGSGGSGTPTPSPNPTPTPTPTPAPSGGTTITITSAGVNPATITVPPGSQVTFVNSDIQNHDMQSNPHPEHTDCTQLAQVGFLVPGQSKQTGNLNTVKTCGYHDHNLFSEPRWQGRIIVQ